MKTSLNELIDELGKLMLDQPGMTDEKRLKNGKELVSVFFDTNFGKGIENYNLSIERLLLTALEDLGNGGLLLKSYRLGIVFTRSELQFFSIPFGAPSPPGTLVASLSLKSQRAFQNHRKHASVDLTQAEINDAVYFLIFVLHNNYR